jgi:hypothetical protein
LARQEEDRIDITARLEDCVRVNCKLAMAMAILAMINQLVDLVMAW